MKRINKHSWMRSAAIVLLAAAVSAPLALAQDSADQIMKKSHLAYYYAADDGIAEVKMTIVDKRDRERTKEFTMLRLDEEQGGPQKYYTYFRQPSDVRRLTFMVHKNSGGNDQRWIYVPAVDLVKPISADDKNSSFVGSHFSYEDVSGRHWTEDNHKLAGDSTIDGNAVWIMESIPKDDGYDGFARKLSYVDKSNYLPLVERYYNGKGELHRQFRAGAIEEIDGILTMTERTMQDVSGGGYTVIEFTGIKYDQGLQSDIFTERYLKNPPRKFIR